MPVRRRRRRLRAHRRAARRLEGAGRASTRRSSASRELSVKLTDHENGQLNPLGINCLRAFPVSGRVVWGARTLRGADQLADEWKYIPVRRTALFIEESLYRGTQVGRVRAERRAAVGADPAERRRVHAQPVPPGRVPGHDAARRLLRQVRQGDDDAERHQPRHRQHRRRLRAAQAGRVRRHQDSSRWPARSPRCRQGEDTPWLSSRVNAAALRSVQELQVPRKWDGTATSPASARSARSSARPKSSKHREGGDPSSSRKSPGRTEYEAITLERGVTHDTEFEKWANKVWNFGSGLGAEVSLKDFRKDIIIEVYNEAGQLAIAYKVFRCWVSEFQALPDLDANANAVAIQHIKLENEGWERDYEVPEPASRPSSNRSRRHAGALDGALLDAWERGVGRSLCQRALTLLSAACPDTPRDQLSRLPMGQRDSRLLALRELTFGHRLNAVVRCPRCLAQLEVALDATDLRGATGTEDLEVSEPAVFTVALRRR